MSIFYLHANKNFKENSGADAILLDNVGKTGMSWTVYGQGSASIKAIVFTNKK